MTWKGTLRLQSMKLSIVSMLNSTGSESSRTWSSNAEVPTRRAKSLNSSPSSRSVSYQRSQRSTASGTRLAGRRSFRRAP